MADLGFDCPHCAKQSIGFSGTFESQVSDPSVWLTVWSCNNCQEAIIVKFAFPGDPDIPLTGPKTPLSLIREHGCRALTKNLKLLDVSPKPPTSTLVDSLPESVEEAFEKARTDYDAQRYHQACVMFRMTLDRATRDLLGDEAKSQNLNNRINLLAAQGRLTDDLAKWAHELRDAGNDFVHEKTPTPSDAADMETLTRLFLMYVYMLPAMLEERKRTREEQQAA